MDRLQRVPALIKLQIERMRARYGWFDATMRVFKRYSEDDGGPYAAALTYYVFFSIFPLIAGAAALLGYVTLGNRALQHQILQRGIAQFPLLGQFVSPSNISTLQDKRGVFLAVAVVLALYSGSGAVVALEHALNRIDRVPPREEGNFFAKRVRSLRWLGALGLLALLSLALGTVAGFAQQIIGGGALGAKVIGHVIGFAVGTAMFVTAYMFLTATRHSWREVLPGAMIAAAAFELLKEFGSWYLNRGAASRSAEFGPAMAEAAGLLVAAYLLCQVILLAAEVNAVLGERKALRRTGSDLVMEEAW